MLRVRDLKFSYPHLSMFNQLSFELHPSEIMLISGPNGSGKSTLLSLVAGLRRGFEGDISFAIDDVPVEDRRTCISYLAAESNGLYGRMSAEQNLLFWASLEGSYVTAQAVQDALERWELSHRWLKNLPVDRFSTGMKRRLGLARVELMHKYCLLLDEPLNGLDKQGLVHFRAMLQQQKERKGIAIIVSHESVGIRDLLTLEMEL